VCYYILIKVISHLDLGRFSGFLPNSEILYFTIIYQIFDSFFLDTLYRIYIKQRTKYVHDTLYRIYIKQRTKYVHAKSWLLLHFLQIQEIHLKKRNLLNI